MDTGSWLGIATLILAIPLGVLTNLLTPWLVAHLEKRKLIKSHRTKEQDLAAYKSIRAFKNGTKDRYPAYIALGTMSVILAIGSATCVILAVLTGGLVDDSLIPNQHTAFLSLFAIALLVFSLLCLAIIVTTARRIERFDEYTTEIRKKWGDNAV